MQYVVVYHFKTQCCKLLVTGSAFTKVAVLSYDT